MCGGFEDVDDVGGGGVCEIGRDGDDAGDVDVCGVSKRVVEGCRCWYCVCVWCCVDEGVVFEGEFVV